jgi:hypothetical protein
MFYRWALLYSAGSWLEFCFKSALHFVLADQLFPHWNGTSRLGSCRALLVGLASAIGSLGSGFSSPRAGYNMMWR